MVFFFVCLFCFLKDLIIFIGSGERHLQDDTTDGVWKLPESVLIESQNLWCSIVKVPIIFEQYILTTEHQSKITLM